MKPPKRRRKRARRTLREALQEAVGFNVVAQAAFVIGPLPWHTEFKGPRPWTPADDGAARLWLRVPAGENLVRGFLRKLTGENRYFPDDATLPTAPAQLVRDGARWMWLAKCPYCHENHRHAILGYWNQLQPRRALGFYLHRCDAPLKGARGYTLIEQEQV